MLLLVPHLFPDPHLLESVQGLRLPALETLLGRGRLDRFAAEGVEGALCKALGVERQQDWPIAPIALLADGGVAGDTYWLRADPVHLRVMRDHVVLADSDALALTREEADVLCAAVGAHFGTNLSPLPLHPQRWYLPFPQAPDLLTVPPSLAVGRNIEATQPHGADARRLRAVLNELQMLLHEHPLNLAREARGALPVTSLWPWGGGRLPAAPASRIPVYADEFEARAIAAFCGTPARPLPSRLKAIEADAVVVLDTLAKYGQTGDALGWREALIDLEHDGFVPLRQQLRKMGARGLHIVDPVHGRALHLNSRDTWRVWKRPRPLGPTA